ncbi:MAG: sigma-54-dependent Fis family transcriptional regulator [Acidobacteriota bacterium]
MDIKVRKIIEINRQLLQRNKLSDLLDFIIDSAMELTGSERGFLMLKGNDGKITIEIARRFEQEDLDQPEIEISRTIAMEVLNSGNPIITDNASMDKRFKMHHSVRRLTLKSILCIPLKEAEKTLGAIYLDNRIREGVFQNEEIQLLEAFGAQATLAIKNASLLELLETKSEAIQLLNRELAKKIDEQREEMEEVKEEIKRQQEELKKRFGYGKIIGKAEKMQNVYRILDKISSSTLPVMIFGESGTGKELVAKTIHYNSSRSGRSFVSENCASIPETLLESELFGYKRGAFTGADRDREGLFKLADGGTLFLDEIGDMSLTMQAKLLRVLQECEIRPIGGKEIVKVDFRIISATNKDLGKMIQNNLFRDDLYYRLNVIPINLPPLRERPEDILLLAEHFLDRIALEHGGRAKTLDSKARRILLDHDWPGNVRELENVLERAFVMSEGDVIAAESLGDSMNRRNILYNCDERFINAERSMIEKVLMATAGDKSKAALDIGWNRQKLYRRMKVLRIPLNYGKDMS